MVHTIVSNTSGVTYTNTDNTFNSVVWPAVDFSYSYDPDELTLEIFNRSRNSDQHVYTGPIANITIGGASDTPTKLINLAAI